MKIRERGPELISCPTCGRTRIDLFSVAEEVERYVQTMTAPIKVAVMGCVVNGPGEAKEADIGIAGGNGVGIIFKKGELYKKVAEEDLLQVFLEELKTIEAELDNRSRRETTRKNERRERRCTGLRSDRRSDMIERTGVDVGSSPCS